MRRAGSSSWRLAQSVEQLLHVLLYTRQALGLPAEEGFDPPALAGGDVPPILVEGTDAASLTAAWRVWWTDHLAWTLLFSGVDLRGAPRAPGWARTAGMVPPDVAGPGWQEWVREVLDVHDAGSPPDSTGIADEGLRAGAVAAWPAAREWAGRGPCSPSRQRAHLAHDVVREVAEDVALDRHVAPHRVAATVLPLDVEGSWWQVWAPGVVVCSFGAAADGHTARVLLREAFTSAL